MARNTVLKLHAASAPIAVVMSFTVAALSTPPVRNEERPRGSIEKHACEPRQRLGGLALTGAAGAEAVDRQPLAVTNARLALGVKSSRVGRVSHSPVSSL